jgi:hypothetical protein
MLKADQKFIAEFEALPGDRSEKLGAIYFDYRFAR